MARFWKRKVELLAGNKSFSGDDFEIDFQVMFDDDPEPNISDIVIYNLSNDSINAIKKAGSVVLNAGYEGDVGTILLGGIQKVDTSWDSVDKATKITVGEGSKAWMESYISRSYKPGVTAKTILQDLSAVFGMELGDFRLTKDVVYTNGRSVSGMLQTVIRQIVNETNSKFHISNGKIYIRPWSAGNETGFLLNSDTGLLESPMTFEDETEGVSGYKVKMLLNHRITVDSILQIQSKTANGIFRVRKGAHYGDFVTEVEVVA